MSTVLFRGPSGFVREYVQVDDGERWWVSVEDDGESIGRARKLWALSEFLRAAQEGAESLAELMNGQLELPEDADEIWPAFEYTSGELLEVGLKPSPDRTWAARREAL